MSSCPRVLISLLIRGVPYSVSVFYSYVCSTVGESPFYMCCMNDTAEAHCCVVTTGGLILMSKYVAESINQ